MRPALKDRLKTLSVASRASVCPLLPRLQNCLQYNCSQCTQTYPRTKCPFGQFYIYSLMRKNFLIRMLYRPTDVYWYLSIFVSVQLYISDPYTACNLPMFTDIWYNVCWCVVVISLRSDINYNKKATHLLTFSASIVEHITPSFSWPVTHDPVPDHSRSRSRLLTNHDKFSSIAFSSLQWCAIWNSGFVLFSEYFYSIL